MAGPWRYSWNVEGKVFKTMVGEISVNVAEKIHLLSKSLKPLPQPKTDAEGVTHDGFKDPELRYRRRYVDLVVNESVKETFLKTNQDHKLNEKFFDSKRIFRGRNPDITNYPWGSSCTTIYNTP